MTNFGKRKPYQIQKGPHAQDIDAMFEQLYRRLTVLEATIGTSGTAAPNALLDGAQHDDTTAGAPTTGDLISAQASKWARKAVGVNAQHLVVTAGAPEWSNDGSGLVDIPAGSIVGTLPVGPHDLLSAEHQDTEPDAPVLGDIIVAVAAGALDVLLYWDLGLPFGTLSSDIDNGGLACWHKGLPVDGLAIAVTPKWARIAKGAVGAALVSTATGVEWGSPGSTSGSGDPVAAHAQQAGNISVANLSSTIISFGATSYDSGAFWNAGAPTRLTIPSGHDGLYALVGQIDADALSSVDKFVVRILHNGVLIAAHDSLGGGRKQVKAHVDCVTGDYLELQVYAEINTAASSTITGGATSTFLAIAKLLQSETVGELLPTPARGVLLKGNAASDAFEQLIIGAAGTVLLSDGVDPGWSTRPTLRDVAESISGVFDFTNGLKERSRSAKLGEWTDIAYAAGNFTANGAMTWTVDVGDQVGFAYTIIGKTCFVRFTLNGTSVGGVVSSQLLIDLTAAGLTAAVNASAIVRCYNSGVDGAGLAEVVGSQIRLSLFTGNWTLSANNTSVQGVIMFTLA